nr:outer membrane protein assembly factor BamC [Pseudoalteromonas sp. MMG010]
MVSLSGCSIFTNDAHNERNYRTHESVKVPEQLETPAEDPVYKMDVAQYGTNPEAKNYRPPAQVLTIAQGSWVEENDKQSRVYFDKNDYVDDLNEFIWRAVKDTLSANNTQALAFDEQKNTLTTDWYALVIPESNWWSWGDDTQPDLERFKFFIEEKSHQRTASLRAELIDFQSENNELTDLLKQQLEVSALNQVIREYDFLYRQLEINKRKAQGNISFTMGFDSKGNAALVTQQNYENVFERFSGFLERLSFTIVEVKPDSGLITAQYNKPQSSVWDSIWGDEAQQLPIEQGQYQILVSELPSNGTSLTWMDTKGELLDPNTMSALQQALEDALLKRNVKL